MWFFYRVWGSLIFHWSEMCVLLKYKNIVICSWYILLLLSVFLTLFLSPNGVDEKKRKGNVNPCYCHITEIIGSFFSYCTQVLSKEVDSCVTDLLKELVRFQDRQYQKDPVKAKTKRRLVMGLREVLKHLKLKKLKCVIISPNCEKIQSKGETCVLKRISMKGGLGHERSSPE